MIKRRKNPYIDSFFIEQLSDVIKTGSPFHLIEILTYYKQGQWCNDCDQPYDDCDCEYCDNCHFNICLCDLGIIFSNFHKAERKNREKVRMYTLKFAKENLNKEQLKKLYEKCGLDL